VDTSKPPEAQWHQAAKLGAIDHMKTLLASKPDFVQHHQKGIGHTALHWAASAGQIETVEWLLESGACVNAMNSSDATPLHSAAGGGHMDVVRCLLGAGADATAKDEDGATPKSLASARGHGAVAATL
jgi:ankyrin repeat protein